MIVQHRQRMTATAARQRKVPLEIPLPQIVRRRVLEPLHVRLPRSGPRVELTEQIPVPGEDSRDAPGRQHRGERQAGLTPKGRDHLLKSAARTAADRWHSI